ncbi:MAG: hypothetical protein ACJAVR_002418 [Paracoccaceae bacterium]|jgi:hypothetical protein
MPRTLSHGWIGALTMGLLVPRRRQRCAKRSRHRAHHREFGGILDQQTLSSSDFGHV